MQQPGGNSAMTATNDQQPINVDVSGAAEDVAVELDAETVARFQFHGQDVGWLLDQRATNRADHPFLVWEPKDGPSRTWTYGEFAVATRKVAVGLAERGVGVGDAVHAGELTPGDVHVSRFEQWVATNAPADVQRPRIDRLGIEDLFDAITISTEAGSAKPDTGIFDVTFEALGWPDKSGAVIVGDKWWEVFRSRE